MKITHLPTVRCNRFLTWGEIEAGPTEACYDIYIAETKEKDHDCLDYGSQIVKGTAGAMGYIDTYGWQRPAMGWKNKRYMYKRTNEYSLPQKKWL